MPEAQALPRWLTVILILATAAPLIAIPYAVSKLEEIQSQFPKLTNSLFWTQAGAALLGVVGALALLCGRRFGVWLVLLSGAGVVGADIVYESYPHAGAATALTTVITLGARANWTRLR